MTKRFTFTAVFAITTCIAAYSQCVTISCPNDTTVYTGAVDCDAVVSYSAPVITNSCPTVVVSDTFFYQGSVQLYIVPPGVDSIIGEVWGAQGGANWVNNTNYGGYVKGKFPVLAGDTLFIHVGQQPTGTNAGWNGGGAGEGGGAGGGGATDIRQDFDLLPNRTLVAGGGGGAGYWSSLHVVGGQGGGLTGGNGYREPDFVTSPGGEGATQVGPGPWGTCINFNVPAMAGSFGTGGTPVGSNCGCEGYGGGGGWYGGAGSGNCRGGGGGSGYAAPAVTDTMMQTGVRAGHGMAVISYTMTAATTVNQLAGLPSGATFPVGTTTQVYEVVSNSGDTATCSFTVTVMDTISPYIACVADVNSNTAIVNNIAPDSLSDNCGINTVTYQLTGATTASGTNDASGTTFDEGVTTVTYLATDNSGNTSSCSFTVTVTYLGTENGVAPAVNIYPNPGHGIITLDLKNIHTPDIQATLINSLGQPVRTLVLQPNTVQQVDVSYLAPGVYYLSMNGLLVPQPVIIY